MEVKCCRAEHNIYLIECLQEQCDQTYIDSCKNTELIHLIRGLVSAKKSVTTSHSSSTFSIKIVWIQTLVGLVLWDSSALHSRSAAFLSKLAIPCSNTWSHSCFDIFPQLLELLHMAGLVQLKLFHYNQNQNLNQFLRVNTQVCYYPWLCVCVCVCVCVCACFWVSLLIIVFKSMYNEGLFF